MLSHCQLLPICKCFIFTLYNYVCLHAFVLLITDFLILPLLTLITQVFQALTTQGTRGVLMVQVTSLTRNSGRVIAKWELGMTSSVSPRQEELRIAYNKGIVNLTYVDDTDSFIKVNSHLVLGKNGSYATFLMPIIGQLSKAQ